MALKQRSKTLAAGLLAGVLIGGGMAMVTPAGATVKTAAAAIDWKAIWKGEIKPRADKRYYTKKASNARYYTQVQTNTLLAGYETKAAHDASLLGYYTKAQSDASYYTKAQSDLNYYTKAAADAKYAPFPTLIRGTFALGGTATAASQPFSDSLPFGTTLSAAPTVHYIKSTDPVPAGCSGTATAPSAAAGNLCVFEAAGINVTIRDIDNANGSHPFASPFGANVWAYSTAAGAVFVYGSWAVRPLALAPPGVAGPGGASAGGDRTGH
jgi:hypothetical protein